MVDTILMQRASGLAQTTGKETKGTAKSAAETSNSILPSHSYQRPSKQDRMVIFSTILVVNSCLTRK